MFWKESRVAELEREVKDLRDKLYKVQGEVAPIRFGEWPAYHAPSLYGVGDPRPKVSHAEAIRLLMDHCGVQFKKIDGTPERIVIEKKPKASL